MADRLLNVFADTIIDLFEDTSIKFSKKVDGNEIKIEILKGFDGDFGSFEKPTVTLTDSSIRISYSVFYDEGNFFQKRKRKKIAEEAKNSVLTQKVSFDMVLHDPGIFFFRSPICATSQLRLNDVIDQSSVICKKIIDHLAFIQSLCKQLKALYLR